MEVTVAGTDKIKKTAKQLRTGPEHAVWKSSKNHGLKVTFTQLVGPNTHLVVLTRISIFNIFLDYKN
ncbi:MAG: hypothetical protein GWP06_03840 [Actinobacteria bacterium]|nr:hypothetical protein [Actinomycetota bacterium]